MADLEGAANRENNATAMAGRDAYSAGLGYDTPHNYEIGYNYEMKKAWRKSTAVKKASLEWCVSLTVPTDRTYDGDNPVIATWGDGFTAEIMNITCGELAVMEGHDRKETKDKRQKWSKNGKDLAISHSSTKGVKAICLHEWVDGKWKQRVQVVVKGITEDSAVDIITKIGNLYIDEKITIDDMTPYRNQEVEKVKAITAAGVAAPTAQDAVPSATPLIVGGVDDEAPATPAAPAGGDDAAAARGPLIMKASCICIYIYIYIWVCLY